VFYERRGKMKSFHTRSTGTNDIERGPVLNYSSLLMTKEQKIFYVYTAELEKLLNKGWVIENVLYTIKTGSAGMPFPASLDLFLIVHLSRRKQNDRRN
jgi:hypothetical protein